MPQPSVAVQTTHLLVAVLHTGVGFEHCTLAVHPPMGTQLPLATARSHCLPTGQPCVAVQSLHLRVEVSQMGAVPEHCEFDEHPVGRHAPSGSARSQIS